MDGKRRGNSPFACNWSTARCRLKSLCSVVASATPSGSSPRFRLPINKGWQQPSPLPLVRAIPYGALFPPTTIKGIIMKKTAHFSLAAICSAMLSTSAISAPPSPPGYLVDSSGHIVMSGTGLCWHTSDWTPAMAVPGCDGVPLNAPVPTKAVAPEPAPAPAPSPAVAEVPPAPAPAPTPAPAPKTIFTDKPLTIEGANFASGSAALKSSAFTQLDTVVEFADKYKDATLTITGYTDNRGNEAANQNLSKRRADAVKAYLVSKRVAADRITTYGKGSANPVGDNKTAAGRARNRRVEINSVARVAQ